MQTSNTKYHFIYEKLKREIINGEYIVGEHFLTEPELQKRFGASRITVRRSVQMLVDEGYLQKIPGVGTILVSTKGSLQLSSLVGFSESHIGYDSKIVITESAKEKKPSGFVASQLKLSKEESVGYQARINWVDGRVIGYQRVYIPSSIGFTDEELSNPKSSIYELFKVKGHSVMDAEETIEAVAADEELAGYLQVSVGSPLLLEQRVTRDKSGKLVEFAEIYYRGDAYRYKVKLQALPQ